MSIFLSSLYYLFSNAFYNYYVLFLSNSSGVYLIVLCSKLLYNSNWGFIWSGQLFLFSWTNLRCIIYLIVLVNLSIMPNLFYPLIICSSPLTTVFNWIPCLSHKSLNYWALNSSSPLITLHFVSFKNYSNLEHISFIVLFLRTYIYALRDLILINVKQNYLFIYF